MNVLGDGCVIAGNGTTYFGGAIPATIYVGGTVNIGNVEDHALLVDGVGTLIVNGAYNWYESPWTGSGATQIGSPQGGAGAVLNIVGGSRASQALGRTLKNYGTVNWVGRVDITVNLGANIFNYSGAVFGIYVDQRMVSSGGAGFWNYNGATLAKTGTIGTSQVGLPFLNGNAGTIRVDSGTLQVVPALLNVGTVSIRNAGQGPPPDGPTTLQALGGYEQDAGSTMVDSGAALSVTGDFTQTDGTTSILGSATVSGDFAETGGNISVQDYAAILTVAGGLTQTDGTMLITGRVSVTGDYSQMGGAATVAAGTGGTTTLTLAGNFFLSGGTLDSSVDLFNFTGAGSFEVSGGTMTDDYGTFMINGGSFVASGGSVTLDNSIVTAYGGLDIQSGGLLYALEGASVYGNVTNDGTLSLYNASRIGNLFITGNYTQTGTLDMGVASSDTYSRIYISNVAAFGGTVNVSRIFGYTGGGSFSLIQYRSLASEFDIYNIPGSWSYTSGSFNVRLT